MNDIDKSTRKSVKSHPIENRVYLMLIHQGIIPSEPWKL